MTGTQHAQRHLVVTGKYVDPELLREQVVEATLAAGCGPVACDKTIAKVAARCGQAAAPAGQPFERLPPLYRPGNDPEFDGDLVLAGDIPPATRRHDYRWKRLSHAAGTPS